MPDRAQVAVADRLLVAHADRKVFAFAGIDPLTRRRFKMHLEFPLDVTLIEFLVAVMNCPDTPITMRLDCAKNAAALVHERPKPVVTVTVEQREQRRERSASISGGVITSDYPPSPPRMRQTGRLRTDDPRRLSRASARTPEKRQIAFHHHADRPPMPERTPAYIVRSKQRDARRQNKLAQAQAAPGRKATGQTGAAGWPVSDAFPGHHPRPVSVDTLDGIEAVALAIQQLHDAMTATARPTDG